MELQCDVGIKSEAEVIIENIQRKLQWWTKAEVKLCVTRQKEENKTESQTLVSGASPWEDDQLKLKAGCLCGRNNGVLN